MLPPPPISTLFPYTTLFRSPVAVISTRGGQVLALKPKEYDLLAFLARHPGRAFSRDHLLRSEEHTSELQSHSDLVCRLLLEKKKIIGVVGMKHEAAAIYAKL